MAGDEGRGTRPHPASGTAPRPPGKESWTLRVLLGATAMCLCLSMWVAWRALRCDWNMTTLAQLSVGMTEADVIRILGEPTTRVRAREKLSALLPEYQISTRPVEDEALVYPSRSSVLVVYMNGGSVRCIYRAGTAQTRGVGTR